MTTHRPLARLAGVLALGLLSTAGPSVAAAHAADPTPGQRTVAALAAAGLDSTIALNNCSASLVRFPTSQDSDRAMMLTNGHCYEGGFLSAGQVLTNKSSTRSGTLLDASGSSRGTVKADQVMYATMTGTDVTLYRLTDTFAAIRTRTGANALTVSDQHPVDKTAMTIPSSYWKTTYSCSINGFVPQLREGEWTWKDSIRYNFPGCQTIHGTSGSPIVDNATLKVIGINNTGNDDGAMCTENNPCEVNADGTTTVQKGQSYGQQTYWFTTCLSSTRAIDLTVPGCLLTGASGGTTPPPTGSNLLTNPGFESGQTGWTGTSGAITSSTSRPAHSGTWKLWLGGNGSTSTENESQTVSIPATAAAPKLSYWIRTDTAETGSTAYDTMKVQVVSGTTTSTLATYSNVGTSSTYAQKTFDLSAYKGKSITLKFLMNEDSSLQTSFVVDDTAVTTG
ncbi:trypsin-like peptidase domain-containing protein [Luteipulveratus sp. YIM 133132]|uniref:trypsin-like peptidase domain-containing protein n=1 Tax=Luteipulveratus flavus TaxID=3031728 RepID=UPI0023B0A8DC|nr:trypsin-like peptidase domain-containing protein [Luteipulveratus sp. YIM 133132]MDE9365916.1 trypsin-like peptidase domain-containing protein [Luteipulveratus sp. YIM 133132]